MAGQNAGGGGGGIGASAIKAGEAFVELVVKDNAFYRGLGKARTALDGIGGKLRAVGSLTFFGAAAGLGALAAVFKRISETKAGLNSEEADRLDHAGELLEKTWAGVESVFGRVVAAILPTREEMGNLFAVVSTYIGVVKSWIDQNQGLVKGLALGVAAAAAVGAGLVALGIAATGASIAIGLVVGAVKLAVAAVGLLLTPVGLVAAAVAGFGYILLTQTENGREWKDRFVGFFKDIGSDFKTTFGGISDALRKGDLALAGEIAMAGLDVVWKRGLLLLQTGWNQFKGFFVDGFHDGILLIELAWNDFSAWLADKILVLADLVVKNFGQTIADGLDAYADMASKNPLLGGAVGKLLSPDLKELAAMLRDGTLEKGIGAAQKRIEAERSAAEDEIHRLERVADKARKEHRDGELKKAQDALAAAVEQRDAAVKRAAELPELKPGGGPEKLVADAVRGTFQLRVASQQFGGGRLTEQAHEATRKLPALMHTFIDTLIDESKKTRDEIRGNGLVVT